jgi:hypothetical protein
MQESVPAAKAYRDGVQTVTRAFQPSGDGNEDTEFYNFLDNLYVNEKSREETIAEDARKEANLAVFVSAVGLFAYGRLDVVEDILNNIPSPRNLRRLAWVLNALLPMPRSLDPLTDIEAVRSWVTANRDELLWDRNEEKFAFRVQSTPHP